MMFPDRLSAGRLLGEELKRRGFNEGFLVLGIPRGGVPVAAEIARILNAPLDVFVVRKLGCPGQEELAMGAIAPGDMVYLDQELIDAYRISPGDVQEVIARERVELERRLSKYRGDAPPLNLEGKRLILVDDGLATGATMQVACQAIRGFPISSLCIAAPVAARDSCQRLADWADEVICLKTPQHFFGVGQWYEHFAQTSDKEVQSHLLQARNRESGAASRGESGDR